MSAQPSNGLLAGATQGVPQPEVVYNVWKVPVSPDDGATVERVCDPFRENDPFHSLRLNSEDKPVILSARAPIDDDEEGKDAEPFSHAQVRNSQQKPPAAQPQPPPPPPPPAAAAAATKAAKTAGSKDSVRPLRKVRIAPQNGAKQQPPASRSGKRSQSAPRARHAGRRRQGVNASESAPSSPTGRQGAPPPAGTSPVSPLAGAHDALPSYMRHTTTSARKHVATTPIRTRTTTSSRQAATRRRRRSSSPSYHQTALMRATRLAHAKRTALPSDAEARVVKKEEFSSTGTVPLRLAARWAYGAPPTAAFSASAAADHLLRNSGLRCVPTTKESAAAAVEAGEAAGTHASVVDGGTVRMQGAGHRPANIAYSGARRVAKQSGRTPLAGTTRTRSLMYDRWRRGLDEPQPVSAGSRLRLQEMLSLIVTEAEAMADDVRDLKEVLATTRRSGRIGGKVEKARQRKAVDWERELQEAKAALQAEAASKRASEDEEEARKRKMRDSIRRAASKAARGAAAGATRKGAEEVGEGVGRARRGGSQAAVSSRMRLEDADSRSRGTAEEEEEEEEEEEAPEVTSAGAERAPRQGMGAQREAKGRARQRAQKDGKGRQERAKDRKPPRSVPPSLPSRGRARFRQTATEKGMGVETQKTGPSVTLEDLLRPRQEEEKEEDKEEAGVVPVAGRLSLLSRLCRVCAAIDVLKRRRAALRQEADETATAWDADGTTGTASVTTGASVDEESSDSDGGSVFSRTNSQKRGGKGRRGSARSRRRRRRNSSRMKRRSSEKWDEKGMRQRQMTMAAAMSAATQAAVDSAGVFGNDWRGTLVAGSQSDAASAAAARATALGKEAAKVEKRISVIESELAFWRGQRESLLCDLDDDTRDRALRSVAALRERGAAQWEAVAAVDALDAMAATRTDWRLAAMPRLRPQMRGEVRNSADTVILAAVRAVAPMSALTLASRSASTAQQMAPHLLLGESSVLRDHILESRDPTASVQRDDAAEERMRQVGTHSIGIGRSRLRGSSSGAGGVRDEDEDKDEDEDEEGVVVFDVDGVSLSAGLASPSFLDVVHEAGEDDEEEGHESAGAPGGRRAKGGEEHWYLTKEPKSVTPPRPPPPSGLNSTGDPRALT